MIKEMVLSQPIDLWVKSDLLGKAQFFEGV